VVILCTLLAILPGRKRPVARLAGSCAVLLVFADYLPRALAPPSGCDAGLWQCLLGVPLKISTPGLAAQRISLLLLRPFARKASVVKKSDDPLPEHDDEPEPRPARTRLPGIHALDNITVNDILVPRSEVDGINLDDRSKRSSNNCATTTRLPVFHSDINQVEAVLNTRLIQPPAARCQPDQRSAAGACYEPYFVPESTPCNCNC
jgi:Mg2+/Co2+ transporter CorB